MSENVKARNVLKQAVIKALEVASSEPRIRRIAFPIISGSIFAYGRRKDAILACLTAFNEMLREGEPLYGRFDEVVLYAYMDEEYDEIKKVYAY
jgi:hypothetical protein